MKRAFSLVSSSGSSDTKRCAETILADVVAKRAIGLAYVVIYAERQYEVHLCGEASRSPTFTRGALGALDDKCSRLIHGIDH